MKRLLIITISLILLTGCSIINTEETKTEAQIIEEISGRKFEYSDAVCLRGRAKVQFIELNRNDEINIIDEDENFYYFDNNGLILAVEKEYVRTENDEPFEEYTGYAYSGAEVFSDYELNDKIADLYKNDEIKVIDKIGKVLLVNYEGEVRYMYQSDVSESYIVTYYRAPVVEEPVYTPSYSGGGGSSSGGGSGSGGGGGGTTPDPTPSSGDAQEISISDLAFVITEDKTEFVPNDSFVEIKGQILLDNTKAYITYFSRSEDVRVLNVDDEYAYVLISGFVGKIEREYLRLESDEEYDAWDGYAYSGAEVFYDFELTDEMDWFYKNDDVHVIDKVEDVYVVELKDGSFGYMSVDDVSETYLPTYRPAPEPEPVVTPSYSGGGGGGGSSPAPEPPAPPVSEESRIVL